jgi:hypothetical protein
MTPQEIADYKMHWMPRNPVRIHSDLSDHAKTWCRRQLERHQWSMTTWTAIYEHTFFFENIKAAQNFEMEFSNWINK